MDLDAMEKTYNGYHYLFVASRSSVPLTNVSITCQNFNYGTNGNRIRVLFEQNGSAQRWINTSSTTWTDSFGLWDVHVYTDAPSTININSGNSACASTSVRLSLSAPGCSQMCFSNDNTNWSAWEKYATTKAWTIASGEGTRTVYARYKDVGGSAYLALSQHMKRRLLDLQPMSAHAVTSLVRPECCRNIEAKGLGKLCIFPVLEACMRWDTPMRLLAELVRSFFTRSVVAL